MGVHSKVSIMKLIITKVEIYFLKSEFAFCFKITSTYFKTILFERCVYRPTPNLNFINVVNIFFFKCSNISISFFRIHSL